ncbi:MAG: transposase [Elusimicrobiota bacterium]
MPRFARILFPGAMYHVMNRGNNRQQLFKDKQDYHTYLKYLRDYVEQFNIIVYAYCLMPNHLHLLVETPDTNLPIFMRSLNIRYMIWFKKKYGLVGHLFQGRYKSIVVDKESYLLELTRYIHLNPARAGITTTPEYYEWSSCREYVENKFRNYRSFVETTEVLSRFGSSENGRNHHAYRTFLYNGISSVLELPPVCNGTICGNEKFIQYVIKTANRRQKIGNSQKRVRRRNDRKKIAQLGFEDVTKVLSEHYKIKVAEVVNTGGNKMAELKHKLMYFLRYFTTMSLAQIGEKTGNIGYNGVCMAIKKVEAKIQNNKMYENEVIEVKQKIIEYKQQVKELK